MAGDGDGDRIGLTVKGQDGEQAHYNVRRTSRLRKLLNEYARTRSLAADSIRFLLDDGSRVTADHTAKQLELKDGDTIVAMVEQTGGGGGTSLPA